MVIIVVLSISWDFALVGAYKFFNIEVSYASTFGRLSSFSKLSRAVATERASFLAVGFLVF